MKQYFIAHYNTASSLLRIKETHSPMVQQTCSSIGADLKQVPIMLISAAIVHHFCCTWDKWSRPAADLKQCRIIIYIAGVDIVRNAAELVQSASSLHQLCSQWADWRRAYCMCASSLQQSKCRPAAELQQSYTYNDPVYDLNDHQGTPVYKLQSQHHAFGWVWNYNIIDIK